MEAPRMEGFVYFMLVLLIALPFGLWKLAEVVWYVISHLQWVN